MFRTLTFLVIGVLASGAVYGFIDGRRKQSAWWVLECEREELAGRVHLLQVRLASKGETEGKAGQAEDFLSRREAGERSSELKARKAALEQEIAAIAGVWDSLDADRLRAAREKAVGTTWEEVRFKERTYFDAQVVAVTDGGVTLKHRHGLAMLRISDLDEDQRDFFGLDEESSKVAMRREFEKAANYHLWADETAQQIARDRYYDQLIKSSLTAGPRKKVPQRRGPVPPTVAAQDDGVPKLKITPLMSPARKLDTSRRVYGSGRTVNYYEVPYTPPANNTSGAP